jgi:hypothetical protein
MGHSNCSECSAVYTFDQKPRRNTCFRCHVKTIRLGYTAGKEDFHGPTVRERQRLQEMQMTRSGIKWEKVPEKAVF